MRKISIPPRARKIGGRATVIGAVLVIGFGASSAVAGPTNSVSSKEVVNYSLNTIDMDKATHALYSNTVPGVDQVSKSDQIAPKTIDESDLNDALAAKVNASTGEGTPGKSYGCDGEVVDAEHPAAKCAGEDGKDSTVPGPAGTNGTNGTNGVSGYQVLATEVVLPAGTAEAPGKIEHTVTCPEGAVPVGGGFKSDRADGVNVFHNMAGGLTKTEAGTWTATGWDVKATNTGAKTNLTAFVTCAAIAK